MSDYCILVGDCREMLRTLPDESVHCVVTSPPYWGLRDYGLPPTVWGGDPDCDHDWDQQEKGKRKDILPAEEPSVYRLGTHDRATGLNDGGRFCVRCGAWRGQLGLEPTPELYVEHMVEVFREVRRVLRRDGTVWLNLGSTYASGTIESEEYVLRDDLSHEERAYVLAELAKHFEAESETVSRLRATDAPAEPDVPVVLSGIRGSASELPDKGV